MNDDRRQEMKSICYFGDLGHLGNLHRNSGYTISCPSLPGRKFKNLGSLIVMNKGAPCPTH